MFYCEPWITNADSERGEQKAVAARWQGPGTDITKSLLCAETTLYLPKPPSLSARETNTPPASRWEDTAHINQGGRKWGPVWNSINWKLHTNPQEWMRQGKGGLCIKDLKFSNIKHTGKNYKTEKTHYRPVIEKEIMLNKWMLTVCQLTSKNKPRRTSNNVTAPVSLHKALVTFAIIQLGDTNISQLGNKATPK